MPTTLNGGLAITQVSDRAATWFSESHSSIGKCFDSLSYNVKLASISKNVTYVIWLMRHNLGAF